MGSDSETKNGLAFWAQITETRPMRCGNGTTAVLLECLLASGHSESTWTRLLCVCSKGGQGDHRLQEAKGSSISGGRLSLGISVEEEKGSRAGRTPCNSSFPPEVVAVSESQTGLEIWLNFRISIATLLHAIVIHVHIGDSSLV